MTSTSGDGRADPLPSVPVEGELSAIVSALLAATPEPPSPDTDPADVLSLAERMLEARIALCARLEALDPGSRVFPPVAAAQHACLVERNDRWAAALTVARGRLGEQLRGARHFRASR